MASQLQLIFADEPEALALPRRALLGCLYAAVLTGCFYGFSLYSQALKSSFDLSQSELDNINTIPYACGLLASLFGMVSKAFGARLAMLIGGLITSGMQVRTHNRACVIAPGLEFAMPARSYTFHGVTCLRRR